MSHIHQVVSQFYDKAKNDVLIGHHFRIILDFEAHIPRIVAFWEIQLLGSTGAKTPPFDLINVHAPLGIKRGEIGRWLVLFRKTLEENPDPINALWEERLQFFEKTFLRFLRL
jgi:hemoglobin